MGRLGCDTCLPLLLLNLPLLLLLLDSSWSLDSCSSEGDYVQISHRRITANFKYRLKNNPRFHINEIKNLTSPWSLSDESLNISTVLLRSNPTSQVCKLCIRIDISVNASGLPDLRGFEVQGLEISRNSPHSFIILRKNLSSAEDLWTVRYDYWSVAPGQYLSVNLTTIPNYGVSITKKYFLADKDAKPQFRYEHVAQEKRFVVSIPDGPDAYARLCHLSSYCDELTDSPKQLVKSSQNISLKYQHLLPCLCIEVFYTFQDSRREKICPFQTHPELYAAELLSVSVQKIAYVDSRMTVQFNSKCPVEPEEVSFCKEENGTCVTIPGAVIRREKKEYHLDSVDQDPHLCFKFTLMNESLIQCHKNRGWDIDLNIQLFHVDLTISSHLQASFIVTICHQNQSSGRCSPQSAIYNVSTVTSSLKLQHMRFMGHVSLPRPDIGSCIMVWRSDVRFAQRYLICSFDYSHRHLGLVVLVTCVLVLSLIVLLFLSCQRIVKIFTAPLWRRTILLVYSSDSAEYRSLICGFADLLQSILGCEVILDLWDMNTVSQIGMLPWFFQKRELVAQQKGKVLIVWSKRSKTLYEQWNNRKINGIASTDANNLFGAAMSCLQKDIQVKQESEHLEQYTMVYFEGLCEKKDIPKSLRKISRFRLFKDLYGLVSKLQDTTCLSPNCLIKAVAKYLMKKLLNSEKSQGLKHHVELCKQKLLEEVT